MRTMQLLPSAALAFAALVCVQAALAQDPPKNSVTWDISACPAGTVASVHHLTLIEIESTNPTADTSHLSISVVCEAQSAALSVRVGESPGASRDLDLMGVEASDWPRLIALALAELAADALEAQIAEVPDPDPDPSPVPSPEPEPEAQPEGLAFELAVEPGGRFFASHPSILLGAQTVAHLMTDGPAGLRLSLGAEAATSPVALGEVSTTLFSGAIGGEWRVRFDEATFAVGGGLRAGTASFSAEAASPNTDEDDLLGIWGGPYTSLGLGFSFEPLVLRLGAEGGLVLWEVGGIVDNQRSVAVEGLWLGFSVSIGVSL